MSGISARALPVAVAAALLSGAAAAQSGTGIHPELQDRYSLELGAYRPSAKTTAHLNSSAGAAGTSFSFEDALGMEESKTTATVLGRIRLGDRWRLEAGYLDLDRSGSRAVGGTINWGDNTFTAGTTVQSKFQSQTLRLSGGYSFIKDANSELGVALGLHTTDFKVSLSSPAGGVRRADAVAPLPTIGVYGAYAFTPKWLVSGRVDAFSLSSGKYDGSLVDAMAKIDYRFHRNFGVGLGYRYVKYDLDVSKSSFNGGVQYKFSGPALYLTGSF